MVAVVFTSCAGDAAAPGSGIAGRVFLGPACPVEVAGSPCPPQPVSATVRVEKNGQVVRTFRSDEDGAFRVPLEPGDYLLVPVTEGTGALSAKPVSAVVTEGTYVDVEVILDTGIR